MSICKCLFYWMKTDFFFAVERTIVINSKCAENMYKYLPTHESGNSVCNAIAYTNTNSTAKSTKNQFFRLCVFTNNRLFWRKRKKTCSVFIFVDNMIDIYVVWIMLYRLWNASFGFISVNRIVIDQLLCVCICQTTGWLDLVLLMIEFNS